MTEDQTAVIELLASPSTHGGAPVERIDTHASIVFLAGGRAAPTLYRRVVAVTREPDGSLDPGIVQWHRVNASLAADVVLQTVTSKLFAPLMTYESCAAVR